MDRITTNTNKISPLDISKINIIIKTVLRDLYEMEPKTLSNVERDILAIL